MESIITVANLKKSYGEVKAIDDSSFAVKHGQLFAFLGPNGAGKSTTIDILCTLLEPDAGEVWVNGYRIGKDDFAIKKSIGVVFQDGYLDDALTVRENLSIRGSLYALTKAELKAAIEAAAKATGIEEFLDRPYGKLSGGQKRRSDIARGLLHKPAVLFLDEPTTGLDPQTRMSVWQTIRNLQKETGMTIFLTTHYMEEAATADYVVVMDKGRIVAQGTPLQLKEQYSTDHIKIWPLQREPLQQVLDQNGIPYTLEKGIFIVPLETTLDALPVLAKCQGLMAGFEVQTGTMDDAFIAITGEEMRG